ncbi:MAG: DUF975 family protein [Lachnospiraceae bacterium]|nr:DUF975 family protein [Lachnospiraceae bacterium]MBD5510116.1 DUF975 family protein [Lachnospiraceae bacterium]
MNRYASSAQLKDKAKGYLTGHYGLLIGILIVTEVISSILDKFVPLSANTAGYILSAAITFLLSVFMGVFNVGTALVYLKFATGNKASLSDIFYGFFNHPEKALKISLVMNVLSLILSLSYSVPYRIYLMTGNQRYLFMMFPCLAAAMILYVPLSLCLSQCYFLILDFPDKSASDILRASFRIMKGHKGRLFYIELSFLPLLLLGAVSLIGLLWIIPYMQMTYAAFYFDIMKQEQR